MRRLVRRQVLAYALGLLTALAGFTVGAAWAGHSAGDNVIHACSAHGNGTLSLHDATAACRNTDDPAVWGITGPHGPQGIQGPKGDKGDTGAQGAQGTAGKDGSISSAVSPNGVFTITLSNAGILLNGPNGAIHVDFSGDRMNTIGGQP
jgi:hypothetical protein